MGGGKRNRRNHDGSRGGGNKNKHQHEKQQQQQQFEESPARTNPTSRHQGAEEEEDDEEEDELDFCQRFFGDPLFSNLNVSLLFLTATFLPMIVWIPHFLSEYRRLRHIQFLEEERQMRMQKARMEVKGAGTQQRQQNSAAGGGGGGSDQNGASYASGGGASHSEGDITILQDSITPLNHKSTIHFPDPHVLNPHVHPPTDASNNSDEEIARAIVLPSLCPDGVTLGYDNWFILRDAISEANAIAAEEFLRWNEYLVKSARNASGGGGAGDGEDPSPPVYRPPDPFVICPGAILDSRSPYRSMFSPYYWASYLASFLPLGVISLSSSSQSRNRSAAASPLSRVPKTKLTPIFINAEDITIECDMCTVDLPGTHFSFGPHAKNVLIRGITFRGATTSSLTFHHHGADVGLEDCYWLYNSGGMVNGGNRGGGPYANVNGNEGLMSTPPGSATTAGAVADLNSTSTVTFYRCVIDDVKQNPKRTTTGAGVANVPGMNPPAGHHVGGGMNQGNGGGVVSSSLTIRN